MEIQKARYANKKGNKRKRAIKFLSFLFAFILLLASSGYSYLAINQPLPMLNVNLLTRISSEAVEVEDIAWPTVGQAAFGTTDQGVLANSGNETVKPIASITKVVTALAIIKKSGLKSGQDGQTRVIDNVDEQYYRSYIARYGSVVPVNAGQTVTDLLALQAMMVVSANNIADSLVRWHFGTMESYIEYANLMLADWGFNQTRVSDASGFSEGSVSTPSELVLLGSKLLEDPVLSEVVSIKEIVWPGWGPIKNTNQLLVDENSLGIKTGNTDEAGSCLLYAYKFGPNNEEVFIGAVMGQQNYQSIFSAAKSIKDSAMPYFKNIEIAPAGTMVAEISSPWNKTSSVVTSDRVQIFGWVGNSYSLDINLEVDGSSVLENQVVGTASSMDRSIKIATTSAIEEPNLFWRLTNYRRN